MRAIIDNMFFWDDEGTFIKDFRKVGIDTKNFIESILKFKYTCKIQE